MATSNREHIPVVPNLEAPKGNWIARNLRLINEDSQELFPATPPAVESSKSGKFDTIYKVDYHDFPTDVFLDGVREKGQVPRRETIRDVLFGNSPTEVFQNWNVPSRLVPEAVTGQDDNEALHAVITGRRGKIGQTRPDLIRQQTLPAITSPRQQKLSKTPPPFKRNSPPLIPARAHTTLDPSQLTTRDRLQQTLQPHTVNIANNWLRQAPGPDKKVIERLLKMQEKKHQLDHAIKTSVKPSAKKNVEDWLETATDSERQVALKFFSSMAGAKLLGGTTEEQTGKLQQVLRTLESKRGQAPGGQSVRRSLDSALAHKDSNLKFVRLLDPQTRANRWMHTTWHHLPEYTNDDPVNNWSSHYIRPHAPTPRHFVIHPDWG